jgi:hypothetical protein
MDIGKDLQTAYNDGYADGKADTIKQFADRLKRYYDENEKYLGYSIAYNIDRVAEELIKGAGAPDNKCVSCGETIPEGRQVCPGCEGGKRDAVPDTEAATE